MIKIAYHPVYCHPLPDGHKFPMIKYELLPEQLKYEGTFSDLNFFEPQIVKSEDVLRAHTQEYFNNLISLSISHKMVRKIGFPISQQLIKRELIITQGTIDCCEFAQKYGVAFNIAGGTHHAYSDSGEGFCILNDVAVAAQKLLFEKKANRILVIDLDVHQGNGTAKIFEKESRVFTFSMHGKDNYPLHKENSSLDVPLKTGIEDQAYLEILSYHLEKILKIFPADFIFYVSGVDILSTDQLGKLKVSLEGCKKRDEMVFSFAKNNQLPIVTVMGGGYSKDIKIILEAHANTFRVANEWYG